MKILAADLSPGMTVDVTTEAETLHVFVNDVQTIGTEVLVDADVSIDTVPCPFDPTPNTWVTVLAFDTVDVVNLRHR